MIPGFVICILTFPGVIVHEAAHMLFCKLRGIPILDVCYFRIGNPAGYVVHGETNNFTSTFLISVGPLIVNTLLCLFICLPAYLPVQEFGINHPLTYVLLWLGISIGMHSFPSTLDAKNLFVQAKREVKTSNLLALISFPLVGLIYIANILSVIWADFFYGVAIGIGIPRLILG